MLAAFATDEAQPSSSASPSTPWSRAMTTRTSSTTASRERDRPPVELEAHDLPAARLQRWIGHLGRPGKVLMPSLPEQPGMPSETCLHVTEDSEFTGWLRGRLAARRMSQRQLAQFSGVHHSTISRLLNGARRPSLQTATRLADVLDGSRMDPTVLSALLRRDPLLSDSDVAAIVKLYTSLRSTGIVGRSHLSVRHR
jgi:DNA-binding XRE family transcriptional regulator